jgi:hypothetical protein
MFYKLLYLLCFAQGEFAARTMDARCAYSGCDPASLEWESLSEPCVVHDTSHSHGRRCVTYMAHPSLSRQAVRYVYGTPVTRTAGGVSEHRRWAWGQNTPVMLDP